MVGASHRALDSASQQAPPVSPPHWPALHPTLLFTPTRQPHTAAMAMYRTRTCLPPSISSSCARAPLLAIFIRPLGLLHMEHLRALAYIAVSARAQAELARRMLAVGVWRGVVGGGRRC